MPRATDVVEQPEGLAYRPEFLSEDEEKRVLAVIDGIEFREVRMRGQTARRTVRHFGYDYDYESWGTLAPAEPLPSPLAWLRDRCAEFAEVAPAELVQTLVSRYRRTPRSAGTETRRCSDRRWSASRCSQRAGCAFSAARRISAASTSSSSLRGRPTC